MSAIRYYDISITPANGGQPLQHWTSHPNGTTQPPDPGALDIEMDLVQNVQHLPGGDSYIRVWGISLQTAVAAATLNGSGIVIKGGMGKGLPLANSQQAGTLVTGTLYQTFANWVGSAMTLDGYLIGVQTPAQATAAAANQTLPPANIVVNWQAGVPLSQAIQNTLSTAYPAYTVSVNISSSLVLSHAEWGVYQTITQLAQWLNTLTADILGGSYTGVSISSQGNTIKVYDQTVTPSTTKAIQFNDMIGQVTWVSPQTVHLPMVMRGDLNIGDVITMPPGQIATTANSYSQFRQASAIKGQFLIVKLRHVGNFRQPAGEAWTTSAYATVYA